MSLLFRIWNSAYYNILLPSKCKTNLVRSCSLLHSKHYPFINKIQTDTQQWYVLKIIKYLLLSLKDFQTELTFRPLLNSLSQYIIVGLGHTCCSQLLTQKYSNKEQGYISPRLLDSRCYMNYTVAIMDWLTVTQYTFLKWQWFFFL